MSDIFYPCPHCEREFAKANGRANHIKACAKRPSDEKLKSLLAQNYGVKALGREFDVSAKVCKGWLKDAGLWADYKTGEYKVEEKKLRAVVEEFARLAIPPGGDGRLASCLRCKAKPVCDESRRIDLLPCEQPDVGQQVYFAGIGIDLAGIWRRMEWEIGLTN